ncbi:MAG TPA: FMN-binding negative transcriptional regulator [Afipia sp.]
MLHEEKRYPPTFGDRSLFEVAEQNPFAIVMSFGSGEPVISHIPMLVDGEGRIERLRGHVARANPHADAIVDGSRILVIFSGPHSYISPMWYEHPRERAPTWNYAVVHVWGTVTRTDDAGLGKMLDDLAAVAEAGYDDPWLPSNYNQQKRTSLMPFIMGFEIVPEKIESRFKLNQHNTDLDRRKVIERLTEFNDVNSAGVARLMQETLEPK